MIQYIDKSAVVAEIERMKDEYLKHCKNKFHAEWSCGTLDSVLSYIDTLEVKEVDLEKDFSQWWKGERAKDYNVDILYERYSNVSIKLAKHFFELGLKAQKGEEV